MEPVKLNAGNAQFNKEILNTVETLTDINSPTVNYFLVKL